MPSGYGHSSQGFNVANFRVLQQNTRKKEPAGGVPNHRSPQEWHRETAEQCAIGTDENNLSSTLRVTSNIIQNAAAKQVNADISNVENALRDKINHTDQLRAALSSSLSEINSEIQQLVMLRAQMEDRLEKVHAKLDINSRRMQTRSGRPDREKTMDPVERQLMNQASLVTNFEGKVKRAIQHLSNEIAQMDQVQKKLHADLGDKEGAMHVDSAVLNINQEGGAAAAIFSKKYDSALKTPQTWEKSTEDNVKLARHWLSDSVRLRKAVKYAIHNSRDVEHQVSRELNSHMMEKLQTSSLLKADLEMKLGHVRDEQARAISTRANLSDALAAKRGPLQQAKERLAARKARPEREHVLDSVESALANEIANLNTITKQLHVKVQAMDKEIARLDGAASMLEDNIRDKSVAINTDQQMVLLDGRVGLTQAPPLSIFTSASNASGPRTQTMRRIQELEQQLKFARREREGMEKTVVELRGIYN